MHTSYRPRSHFRSCLGSGFLVLAVVAFTGGVALAATKTVIRTKGMEATAAFDTQQVRTCVGGATALDTMSVHISMFESVTNTNSCGLIVTIPSPVA